MPILVAIALLVVIAVARSAEIRERATAALGEGVPAREAALARGFVLGEDDGLDEATKEDFIRAGLSHLTAVSGENVTLLALLAMPILAAFGIPLRERLVWAIGLIAVYVPLAGSAPSIQRAGVMGAVGLLATLAGRRASRLYALGVALVATLAIDPSVAADVGWQLSFAAVLGILLLAAPIRGCVVARLGEGRWRHALAEGIAVTVAATLATGPLIAFVFEEVSLTSLAANVLAMPAVAPAMWLGMVSAALSQVPGIPLTPINGLDALLLAYIAQVAAWFGRPGWAVIHVHIDLAAMFATYAALAAAIVACAQLARARRLATARAPAPLHASSAVWPGKGVQRWIPVVLAAGLLFVLGLIVWPRGSRTPTGPPPGLRIEVLDVGQGDAILLQPRSAPAVLVDGGPPGDELVAKLRDAGVERLGAAIVTHDQSDHAAGIAEALGRLPISRLAYGRLDRRLIATARADDAVPERLAAGTTLRSGSLRLEVLWPPPELLAEDVPRTDPNALALVIRARWHRFTMLLTADAEAESTPLDPGPIDVLKVAHHGSEDAGLGPLLDRIRPRLAVISVGADNPYGHPTPDTLATLTAHHVPTLRTDSDGTIEIDVTHRGFTVDSS
ncbi:MAG: ComEC/Rec2 family competence protein [Actinobacteria bacterium]|nr:ComEC/Rec2 family competence protein [Actinomycetota bacterium]